MTSQKMAHTMVDVEAIKYGQIYCFSYNPEDSRQYWNQEDRIQKFYTYHKKITFCSLNCTFKLHMEISRLGRLHFHGTIQWADKFELSNFLVDNIKHLMSVGTFEIDTIADPIKWNTYCNKQDLIPLDYLCIKSGEKVKRPNTKTDGFKDLKPYSRKITSSGNIVKDLGMIPKNLSPTNPYYDSS